MTSGDETSTIVDKAAIRQLLDLYHAAINFRDWTLLPQVFLPDATWFAPEPIGLRFEGLAAIEEGFRASVGRQEILAQTSSGVVVDLDDQNGASVRSTLMEVGQEPAKAPWSAIVAFDDKVVRTADGWRIASRIVRLRHIFSFPVPEITTGA
ncbi:nuclear transport factor 2 family protein [Caulobacter soli]|uniref:nuclear transport factor 2 family protein n=1 Tax=Caulobacter soli TaxID=2708539 RepID=UPI0013EA7E74|nr:nuclear transport factor 2 family protein [Caulobacter soli]